MQHDKTTRLRTYLSVPVLGLALVCLGGASPLDGCNPTGDTTPAHVPALKITSVNTSANRAQPGQVVTVDWELEDPQLLARTEVRMYSPILGLFDKQQVTTRDTVGGLQFVFQSPVTIEIVVADDAGHKDSVAFDVRYDEQYFLDVNATNTIAGFPALGSQQQDLHFQSFGAFYDRNNDGSIDFLAKDPRTATALPPGRDFLAVSQNSNPSTQYGMTFGGSFPILTPNFLSTSYGSAFRGRKADAIVFGSTVAYSGDVFDVKTPHGTVKGVHGAELGFEAIDIELVYVSDTAGVMQLADAFIGNLDQGLMTTIMRHNDILLSTGCVSSTATLGSHEACSNYSISPTTGAPMNRQYNMPRSGVGEIHGSLRATTGWSVQTANDILHPQVQLGKVEFSMPMFTDDDQAAGGRLNPSLDAIQFRWQ